MYLNISSRSRDKRARRLSNFSADSFEIDGQPVASVEGFIQGIKFPPGQRRHEAFRSSGLAAKKLGAVAGRQLVWWRGRVIPYGSNEHHQLIARAIQAKFEQNPEAMRALLETKGMTLTHNTGSPELPDTSLPGEMFIAILTAIRDEAIKDSHT